MATFSYTRTKLNVNTTVLTGELTAALSGICLYVVLNGIDQVTMVFDYNLPPADIIIMETVLANHTGFIIPTTPVSNIDPTNPADSPVSLNGQMHQVLFCRETSASNKWLSVYGDGRMYSNTTSFTMPWRSKLVGITFVNSRANVGTRLQIYSDVTDPGNSYVAGNMIYEWSLANVRSAQMMTIQTPVIVEAGERLGMFTRKVSGSSPRNVNVMTYWQIIDSSEINNSQTYTQNIELDYNHWSENHG